MSSTLTGLAPSVTFAENTVNATPQLLDGDVAFTLNVHAGQNYGDTVALDRFKRTHRAIAVGETEIDFLSAETLQLILVSEPAIVTALYRVAAHRTPPPEAEHRAQGTSGSMLR